MTSRSLVQTAGPWVTHVFVRLKEDGTPRDGKEGGLSPKFVSPQELEMMGESVQNPSNMATDLDGLVESLDKGKKFR